MNINSAYLLIPVVLSSSFAFMFPISTLNNALVFNNKFFRMNDMVNLKMHFLQSILKVYIFFLLDLQRILHEHP